MVLTILRLGLVEEGLRRSKGRRTLGMKVCTTDAAVKIPVVLVAIGHREPEQK